jgi:hypothetical protein
MSERFYSGSNVPQEAVTKAVPSISTDHEAIHLGWGFSASYYAEGVADNGVIEMLVLAPASGKVIHLKQWKPWGEGGLNKIEIFEAPTHTGTTGTLITPANRNRYSYSTTAAAAVVRSMPTITADGTLLDGPALFGGGGVGAGSGGSDDMDNEIVMKANTKYLIRCTNLSGAAKALGLWLFWYEE